MTPQLPNDPATSPTQHPDYQHGYATGVAGIERDVFEGYLSSEVSLTHLNEQIQDERTALERVNEQIGKTQEQRKTAFDQLQQHTRQAELLTDRVERLQAERSATEAERATLLERRRAASPEYSLLAGLLFFVTGLAFVFGDLIISHEIVAYALNIRNNFDAWAFAVGLAGVSVLLKPAYDRLIEEPYHRDRAANESKYAKFKLWLAIFAIATLGILGWFRYEAYRTDQLKGAINKAVRDLRVSSQPTDPSVQAQSLDPTTMTQIEKQLRESEQLNLTLVNSPFALLSFVLSGILFAIAGAVCLGIALPVLSAYWFRWCQADFRLGRLRRRLRKQNRQLEPLEAELAEQQTCRQVLDNFLTMLPDPETLRSDAKQHREKLEKLYEEVKLARTDSRISNYADGYVRGLAARDAGADAGLLPPASVEEGGRTTNPDGTPRQRRTLRPHEALRKLIADNLSGEVN